MAKQLVVYGTGKAGNIRRKRDSGKNATRPMHEQGFLHSGVGSNSTMDAIWSQLILRSGNVRINSFVDLLYLTNYVETLNKRAKVCAAHR